MVVAFLASTGWRVRSVADTAARQRGVDVLADRGQETVAVEVKGFPGREYADPARAGERKPTQPSTQAKHWYAEAVLAAMLTRSRRPQARSVIALPRFRRYQDLYDGTAGSLARSAIELWWVNKDGTVAPAAQAPT
jgi:Holliday junction resolvase-like predicted endonuclease